MVTLDRSTLMNVLDLAESGLLPDPLIRVGIRQLLSRRRREMSKQTPALRAANLEQFVADLCDGPLAVETDTANAQHYELPAEFFERVLGPRLKYSACYFNKAKNSLEQAENQMLALTCQRAEINNGMRILDLGCGWGSLTLWMAERYRRCHVLAVSNSHRQRDFILARARDRGLDNVDVTTQDMRYFDTDARFDRIVSIEMLEHLRNYQRLFQHISKWLDPHGKAFVHIFCHRETPYFFQTDGAANWMGRHFFTGGMMPSEHLFEHFGEDLQIERQWRVNGLHYWRTCEAWLQRLDENRQAILACLSRDHATGEAKIRLQRWRMFFMACAELFRYRGGQEWFVAHYLFQQRAVAKTATHGHALQATL